MNKTEIMNKMTRSFHRTGLKLKKHSPKILLGVGVTGVVASSVMACKATLKINEILDETKDQIEKIHDTLDNPEYANKYTEEDGKKDLALVYVQTGVKLVKLYGPSVVLGAASIGCIIGSHRILTQRNVALATAYAAVEKNFKGYRSRVIDRFGEELDRELRYNIKAKEIEETVIDEDGKETTVKKTVDVVEGNPNDYSQYAIVFDDGNTGWQKDAELNKFFLLQQQNFANERLQAKGHLFLNEVYDMLGARRTKAGQHVGWVYDKNHPVGDNYVDFGMFDVHREGSRDFINGRERVIILDFNVDGVIDDLI